MTTGEKVRYGVGWLLVLAVSGLMIFASSGKLLGNIPPEALEPLQKMRLEDKVKLIGAGELISALLLLIPRTASLGVLLASAFWGGAILTHMSLGEPYVLQSALLVATWVGAALRYPPVFGTLLGIPASGRGA
jgi:hypothetical protein